jgi:hypothetical protein
MRGTRNRWMRRFSEGLENAVLGDRVNLFIGKNYIVGNQLILYWQTWH